MTVLMELPTDQEDKANEALGALHGLYDLMSSMPCGETVKAESITYLVKLCIYSVQQAVPDGCTRHPRAVNDVDTV